MLVRPKVLLIIKDALLDILTFQQGKDRIAVERLAAGDAAARPILATLFGVMEQGAAEGPEDVKELVSVSFLENLAEELVQHPAEVPNSIRNTDQVYRHGQRDLLVRRAASSQAVHGLPSGATGRLVPRQGFRAVRARHVQAARRWRGPATPRWRHAWRRRCPRRRRPRLRAGVRREGRAARTLRATNMPA